MERRAAVTAGKFNEQDAGKRNRYQTEVYQQQMRGETKSRLIRAKRG